MIDELSDGKQRAGKKDKSLNERTGIRKSGKEEGDNLIDQMIMKH